MKTTKTVSLLYNIAKAAQTCLSLPKRARQAKLWQLAIPYLKKCRPNDLAHTLIVIQFVQDIAEKEGGNLSILIPAAIIHDLGWARVPHDKQLVFGPNREGLELHLKHGEEIAHELLPKAGFSPREIEQIIELIRTHKFAKPNNNNQRIFVDADQLSKTTLSQFWNMAKTYNQATPTENLAWLRKKRFYTRTGEQLNQQNQQKRAREIKIALLSGKLEAFVLNLF